jgi:hypothetical protein
MRTLFLIGFIRHRRPPYSFCRSVVIPQPSRTVARLFTVRLSFLGSVDRNTSEPININYILLSSSQGECQETPIKKKVLALN